MTTLNITQQHTTPSVAQDITRAPRVTLRGIAIGFIIVALVLTGYMSYQKFSAQSLQCSATGVFNCAVLENSAWAQLVFTPSIIIPTAFLGFMCHSLLLSLYTLENRIALLRTWNRALIFGITLFGFMYHCYLTFYVAIYTMRALCTYCLIAHFIMTMLLIIASIRLIRDLKADQLAAVA